LSQKVLDKRPDITFYLFEPIMEFCEHIFDRFKDNNNVYIFNAALMHENGVSQISKHDNNLGYNTISTITDYGEKENIAVFTMTTVVKELNSKPPDFIKVDVEQSEYYFIEGCKELFNSGVQPAKILMEIGIYNNDPFFEKEKEMIEYLFSLGYKKFDYDKSYTYDAIFEK